jgi:chromosome segregation ATPase
VSAFVSYALMPIKIKEEISDHGKKMEQLQDRWTKHKEPLESENEALRQSMSNKKLEFQEKMQETKELRKLIEDLNADLNEKEALLNDLNQEMANNSNEISRSTNRQFYTKRILEIVEVIDKQRKEINKVRVLK